MNARKRALKEIKEGMKFQAMQKARMAKFIEDRYEEKTNRLMNERRVMLHRLIQATEGKDIVLVLNS